MIKKIAILVGGYSKESVISLESGKIIYQNLCRNKYYPYKVFVSKNKWVMIDENNKEYPINKKNFSVLVYGNTIKFDCVFIAIHGSPGENGIFQAYFELLNIPYTGCDFYNSSITFNKKYCLSFLNNFGINTTKFVFLNKKEKFCKNKIIETIGIPCFVKPNKSGSSLGVSKVKNKIELNFAINNAFKEDDEVIIESFLSGIEVSVGVFSFNNKKIFVLPITEIISKNDFFDFESKYSGESKIITPANISKNLENKLQQISKKIYKILNLSGVSRSEYIIVNNIPYFLEINTIPALSKNSILPKQLKAAGISLSYFFHRIISSSITK